MRTERSLRVPSEAEDALLGGAARERGGVRQLPGAVRASDQR
jgi:hypothetical protein